MLGFREISSALCGGLLSLSLSLSLLFCIFPACVAEVGRPVPVFTHGYACVVAGSSADPSSSTLKRIFLKHAPGGRSFAGGSSRKTELLDPTGARACPRACRKEDARSAPALCSCACVCLLRRFAADSLRAKTRGGQKGVVSQVNVGVMN